MNNWHLAVCGLSHKTAPLECREKIQIGRDEIAEANASFCRIEGIMESAIVATCNRVEFYFVSKRKYEPFDQVKSFYDNFRKIDIIDLKRYFYTKTNHHTAAFLFHVAAGIDSMVLGENQILGQIKDAYSSACAVKTTGRVIHRLFHQSFRIGKQVRTDTEMGRGACSVSGAAVELLKSRLQKINDPIILFVGINQMIKLAASNLSHLGYNHFYFANRTLEKAVSLAKKYNASAFTLDELPALLDTSNVVISCTGSKEPVITGAMLNKTLTIDGKEKKTIIDLAIPRDVEIEKSARENIELFDLEDIKQFVKDQQNRREMAIPQAKEIIERKLDEFIYWYSHLLHEPLYNGLENLFETIRHEELDHLIEKMPPDQKDDFERATKNVVNKLLHIKARTDVTKRKTSVTAK